MTVVTTADTSQLYALAARHGLKLHGPLTVNELGLDYRIVIATVDDGRRWVRNGHAVDDSLLQYLSPLGWEHINLTGDYLWRSSAKIGAGKFRPLRPLQPA